MRKIRYFHPVMAGSLCLGILSTSAAALGAPSALMVPLQAPTIQAAIEGVAAGGTIRVLPGVYAEQLVVDKDLTIVGSGLDTTRVQAPGVLAPNELGMNAIVEVTSGANVQIRNLTVSGPGPGSCGSLYVGIHVLDDSTLGLTRARVTKVRDEPAGECFPAGAAIVVGLPPFLGGGSTGHAFLKQVVIDDFQFVGVSVDGTGSTLDMRASRVTGNSGFADGVHVSFGASARLDSNAISHNFNGVLVSGGSSARIERNTLWGHTCRPPLPCGSDPFNEYQLSGITLVGAGSETLVRYNMLLENDAGITSFGGTGKADVSDNFLLGNLFGALIWNGSERLTRNKLLGGSIGVGVVAASADAGATLLANLIAGTSVAPTREFACCSFSTQIVKE